MVSDKKCVGIRDLDDGLADLPIAIATRVSSHHQDSAA